MPQIKEKLVSKDKIISKADKGNFIVIIHQNTYREKIMEFIGNNKFTNIKGDLTKKFHKEIGKNINECPHIIHKDKK